MTMEKDILVSARVLLSDPQSWTQSVEARGASGRQVHVLGRAARSFCLEGAIRRAAKDNDELVEAIRFRVLGRARARLGDWCALFEWNDDPTRTHAEVLALLDKAIEAAS